MLQNDMQDIELLLFFRTNALLLQHGRAHALFDN